MAYNKQYSTRHSGRFNTPGQFVPAGDPAPQVAPQLFPQAPRKPPSQNLQMVQLQMADVDMKQEMEPAGGSGPAPAGDDAARPHWMKTKLAGVKKVSNKERRRRQNENLRRLLTPKNALMVLNEMMPNEQLTNQFKVEPSSQYPGQYYCKQQGQHNFCADLTLDGNTYKGYGDNKLTARNAAAEQAIRDLIIKKMTKVMGADNKSDSGSQNGEPLPDEEALPMIQLASFALHKLFAEWEFEGHKVPQLKPTIGSVSEGEGAVLAPKPKPARKPKELPAGASGMHPCMLLTYMRPHLEYRELAMEGDRPQNMVFTLGVDVDGATYIGKASNKKEARKAAARAACQALFNVTCEGTQ